MPSRTCLITGATSGIGRATAMELGRLGWDLWVVGRDVSRGESVAASLAQLRSGASARFVRTDLSSLAEVRSLAAQIREESPQLDVLINNAGARNLEFGPSPEGIERTFAANHLGHFLLTCLLLDPMARSSGGRIVNVASGTHAAGRGDYDLVLKANPYDGRMAYAESKLANILFTMELARRLGGTSIKVNAVDPGGVATRFAWNNGWAAWLRHCLYYLKQRSLLTPRQACQTIVWLAASEDAASLTGGYYSGKKPAPVSEAARDAALAARLWDLSLDLARMRVEELPAVFRSALWRRKRFHVPIR